MARQFSIKKLFREYGLIIAGCAVYALAFNWFFQPNHIAFGGFTGVAQILNAMWSALPVGVVTIVMNVPLFIIGVRKLGPGLLFASLLAMGASSLMVDILASLYTFPPMEPLLASIYGGVLLGLSLGMLLLVNATTGGTELLARLLKYRFRHLPIGRLCLAIDLTVITAYALVFHHLDNALYGLVALYISTIVMDMVIYGSRTAELAYIISGHSAEIAQALLDLEMGITLLDGTGGFSGDRKKVILCAFKRHQVAVVKSLVTAIDPNAFIIVCQAHEVLGEGFGIYDQNSL